MLDIVEEHFDELDFLWEQREANLFTPDWDLADLAWHEERAEAHLDGLRLAQLHGIDLAVARIAGGEMGAAIASTLVLCADASERHLGPVRAALRAGDPPVLDGVRRALRHRLPDALRPTLDELAGDGDALRAATAMDVLAFHRLPIAHGDRLHADPAAAVRCLAFGVAQRTGRLPDTALRSALEHADAAVRRAALQAAAWTGWPELLAFCRASASRATDPDPVALSMLAVLGCAEDAATLQRALARPELAGVAVQALGALGLPTSVPLLLDLMRDPKLGVPAAKAYRRLTGSDAAFGEKPFPPPAAEGEDASEELPPAPDAARADWRRRAASMPASSTCQHGRPMAADTLPPHLDALPLDSRRDVYLRLRASRATVPELELEALARQQRR